MCGQSPRSQRRRRTLGGIFNSTKENLHLPTFKRKSISGSPKVRVHLRDRGEGGKEGRWEGGREEGKWREKKEGGKEGRWEGGIEESDGREKVRETEGREGGNFRRLYILYEFIHSSRPITSCPALL